MIAAPVLLQSAIKKTDWPKLDRFKLFVLDILNARRVNAELQLECQSEQMGSSGSKPNIFDRILQQVGLAHCSTHMYTVHYILVVHVCTWYIHAYTCIYMDVQVSARVYMYIPCTYMYIHMFMNVCHCVYNRCTVYISVQTLFVNVQTALNWVHTLMNHFQFRFQLFVLSGWLACKQGLAAARWHAYLSTLLKSASGFPFPQQLPLAALAEAILAGPGGCHGGAGGGSSGSCDPPALSAGGGSSGSESCDPQAPSARLAWRGPGVLQIQDRLEKVNTAVSSKYPEQDVRVHLVVNNGGSEQRIQCTVYWLLWSFNPRSAGGVNIREVHAQSMKEHLQTCCCLGLFWC